VPLARIFIRAKAFVPFGINTCGSVFASELLTGWCCRLTRAIVGASMGERREETYRKHRIAAEAAQAPAGRY